MRQNISQIFLYPCYRPSNGYKVWYAFKDIPSIGTWTWSCWGSESAKQMDTYTKAFMMDMWVRKKGNTVLFVPGCLQHAAECLLSQSNTRTGLSNKIKHKSFLHSSDIFLFSSLWKSGSGNTETCSLQVAFSSPLQWVNEHPLLVVSHCNVHSTKATNLLI